jgi:hypothetical protein
MTVSCDCTAVTHSLEQISIAISAFIFPRVLVLFIIEIFSFGVHGNELATNCQILVQAALVVIIT